MLQIYVFIGLFLWSLKYMCMTLLVLMVVMGLCFRFTIWGKQFWRLNRSIIIARSGVKWWIYVLTILFLVVMNSRVIILASVSLVDMVNAVQKENPSLFWPAALQALLLASLNVTFSVLVLFLQRSLSLYWRALLTNKIQSLWLKHNNNYLIRFLRKPIDNPDQLIDLDTSNFADKSVSIPAQCIPAMMTLVQSIAIIWHLSFSLRIGSIAIPKAMLIYSVIYVVLTTGATLVIGKPLIKLNFHQKKLEANFRYSLAQLRFNSKEIALVDNADEQNKWLKNQFLAIYHNAIYIIRRQAVLGLIADFPGGRSAAVFLVEAPAVFHHLIGVGEMLQASAMVSQVVSNCSTIQQKYSDFTDYQAALIRLDQFLDACEEIKELSLLEPEIIPAGVVCDSLTVLSPDHSVLISELSFALTPGDSMLIMGESGVGKSSLLLALAGLWPFADGLIALPERNKCMFIPQQWYLPQGSLRSIVTSNLTASDCMYSMQISDSDIHSALDQVGLSELSDLDIIQDWSTILSPGQAQRVSIARAILARPEVIFLDESTSALDEQLEEKMYQLLKNQLNIGSNATIISIGHRSTLLQFHNKVLTMSSAGEWMLSGDKKTALGVH